MHKYKNLTLSLPLTWQYSLEDVEGGVEAEICFDPQSESALRLSIIKFINPENSKTVEDVVDIATSSKSYVITTTGCYLTNQEFENAVEAEKDITLMSRRLVNIKGEEVTIVVVTYTFLTSEKNTPYEKETLNLLENSLQNATLD